MAANPRIVTEDRQILWDGVQQRLPKGQQIDVPPGSALEREIGADYLVPLPGSPAAQPPAEEKPQAKPQQEEAAPAKPVAQAKKADSGTEAKDATGSKDGAS